MSSFFSFFNFVNEVLNIKFDIQEKYNWYQKTSEVGFIYPLKDICIISDRPESIKMKNGLLHSENSPSIKYTDGFSIWSLNGVRVNQEIVETPAEQLDPHIVLKEANVEIRREIVRKIGIERVCQKLNAQIIEKGLDYNGIPCELLNLDLGDKRKRPYIKLRNASIDKVYHLEGVPPDCDTLEKVWNFRNGTAEKPIILT